MTARGCFTRSWHERRAKLRLRNIPQVRRSLAGERMSANRGSGDRSFAKRGLAYFRGEGGNLGLGGISREVPEGGSPRQRAQAAGLALTYPRRRRNKANPHFSVAAEFSADGNDGGSSGSGNVGRGTFAATGKIPSFYRRRAPSAASSWTFGWANRRLPGCRRLPIVEHSHPKPMKGWCSAFWFPAWR